MWGLCFICPVRATTQNGAVRLLCLGAHSSCRAHWAPQWQLLRVLWPWELREKLCGKWALALQPQTSPRQVMAGLKAHSCVSSADAVLSSGSLRRSPWFCILHNHFSTWLVARTILFYSPRKKLGLSFHWFFWRVSCLCVRMLQLPPCTAGLYSGTFQQYQ